MSAGRTAPEFETLLYTDCRAGQGLSGAAGLQFQARSSQEVWNAAPLVQRSLLYDAPSSWMLARRPVGDYPPSFAHVREDYLATGRGQYLGREASGSREGNQVTHAVITSDPASYGHIRPAQLLGTDWWISTPVEGTVCPPVRLPAVLEPDLGDFELDRLRDFVAEQPGGQDFLAALRTALLRATDPQGQRVLFVGDDTRTVLRWLAAGTVLLPQHLALDLSFKVFTTDPVRCDHAVVAIHPDWGVDVELLAGQGFAFFDLCSGESSPGEVDRTSYDWVTAFLTEDPYDVRDAVEVAGVCGLSEPAAAALGRAVQWGVPPPAALETEVVDWVCRADPALARAYGTEVFDAVTTGPAERGVQTLRLLEEAAGAGRIPGRAVRARRLLLEREIARALHSSGEACPVDQDPACEPRELLLAAMRRVRGSDFETLLDLVHRHHVVLSASELADCSQRFVSDWAEHPGRPVTAGTLAERSLLTGLLREELRARTRARPSLAWRLGEEWWELLLPSVSRLRDRLDAAVIAAAVARGTPEQRAAVVATQLDAADAAGDPRAVWAKTVTVLWRACPATDHELVELAGRAPAGTVLPLYLIAGLRDRVLAPTADPTALDLCGTLYDAGLLPPEPSLLSRVRLDRELQDLCERLPRTGPETVLGELQRLGEPVASVVLARESVVRAALLRSDPAVAAELLRYLPGELRGYFLSWLAVEVEAASNVRPVVLAFYLARLADEELAAGARVRLEHFLRAWPERAPVHLVSEASRAILLYGAVARSLWSELVPAPPTVESRRGLFRRSTGRW